MRLRSCARCASGPVSEIRGSSIPAALYERLRDARITREDGWDLIVLLELIGLAVDCLRHDQAVCVCRMTGRLRVSAESGTGSARARAVTTCGRRSPGRSPGS